MKQLRCLIMPYETLSVNMSKDSANPIYERFARGSLSESVQLINSGEYQIEANIEHVFDNALTRLALSNKNMTLEENEVGVYANINLVDESGSNDVWEKVNAGIVNKASIEWQESPQNKSNIQTVGKDTIITRSKAKLVGFGIVASPAYPRTHVEAFETAEPTTFNRAIDEKEFEQIKKEVDNYNRIQIHEYYAFILRK